MSNRIRKINKSKIMKFNELNTSFDLMDELYSLHNGDLNALVNDLAKAHDQKLRKEIVEDMLFVLDDIKEVTQEKFHRFEDELKKYISEQ